MNYRLPTSAEIGGVAYEIRSDYRAVLDICTALSDPELNEYEKSFVALDIFYPGWAEMPQEHYKEALEWCFWFVNGGDEEDTQRKAPRLVDWEQDFRHIVAPINRVMGEEIRAVEYLHWWTFLAAYYEIGDCLFAQVVRIRNQRAKGQRLSKEDAKWYRENRRLVDLKRKYTDAEEQIKREWGLTK